MSLPTTTITGKVYTPNGVIVTAGSMVCILSQAASVNDAGSGATERVAGLSEFSIQSSGDVQAGMALVPNDAMTPTGTYYRVRFTVTAPVSAAWEESWSVPSTPDPIEIGDITRLFTAPALVLPSNYRDPAFYRAPNTAKISGRAYFAGDVAGSVASNVLIGNGNLRAFPFVVPRSGVIDRMIWQVAVAGSDFSADGRMSIYANTSDADPYPGALIQDGTEARVDQTGVKTSTVSLVVSANTLLWFAFNHNDTSGLVQLTGIAATGCFAILGRSDAFGLPGLGVQVGQAYTSGAGNPANFPTTSPTVYTATIPALGVRYASAA